MTTEQIKAAIAELFDLESMKRYGDPKSPREKEIEKSLISEKLMDEDGCFLTDVPKEELSNYIDTFL